jgi:hypothetical protein
MLLEGLNVPDPPELPQAQNMWGRELHGKAKDAPRYLMETQRYSQGIVVRYSNLRISYESTFVRTLESLN